MVVADGGDEPSGLEAALSFHRVHANQVQVNVSERGQVVGAMTGSGAHLIVVSGNIHAPAQAVLHRIRQSKRTFS